MTGRKKKSNYKLKSADKIGRTGKIIIVAGVVLTLILAVGIGYSTYAQERAKNAANAAASNQQDTSSSGAAPDNTDVQVTTDNPNLSVTTEPANNITDTTVKHMLMSTDRGDVEMEIYPDLMPVTAANFEKLLAAGFYNGLTFHRVEDWVVQGGDPQGDGTGGPGWTIKLETSDQLKNVRGALAMARSQEPDTAGSQFYILKKDASWLDGDYAVFGKVTKGMEVIDQIQIGDKIKSINTQ